jgi:hypothetical protein
MKKRLMSDVNAVEIADGDDRIFKRPLDLIETIDKFHEKSYPETINLTCT